MRSRCHHVRERSAAEEERAQAGIPHHLRIELDGLAPTALVFALDGDTYVQAAEFAPGEATVLDAPFPVSFDLAALIDS